MTACLIAMGLDPLDLGLEVRNACRKLVLRIGIKVFLRQQAGGIALGSGKIFVHVSGKIGRTRLAVNRANS